MVIGKNRIKLQATKHKNLLVSKDKCRYIRVESKLTPQYKTVLFWKK